MSHRAAIDARLSRIAIRVVICATLALGAAVAGAAMSDVARETRWAEQIVPQLVVGDAVWLATPRQPRVLALYTDGLVERPGVDIDEGITALRVALAKVGAPAVRPGRRPLAGVADRLTATARHSADRPDDIALLLATRRAAHGNQR